MDYIIRDETLEYIARDIGDRYTGFPLSEKLKKIVPANDVIYPETKWKMVFDVMKTYSVSPPSRKNLEILTKIIEFSIHPVNYKTTWDKTTHEILLDFNERLKYDGLTIKDYPNSFALEAVTSNKKTDIDYIIEIRESFTKKYKETKIKGLKYYYELGVSMSIRDNYPPDEFNDNYSKKLNVIKELFDIGYITKYEVVEHFEPENEPWPCDYAVCKIDEEKLLESIEPLDSEIGKKSKKIIHEHIHAFKNSIQEKDIVLNHNYKTDTPKTFYITKKDDDFYYKGLHILATKKNNDYYKVFCSLYAKLPDGGEISYKDLITEIKSRMPEQKNKTNDEMQKFIQRNLTDRGNGFMRYANIPETEDNGKPLISIIRGSGVSFNNKTG